MALLLFSYPLPPSSFLNVFTAMSLVAIPLIGLSEVIGIHLQYSKFWNVNPRTKQFRTVSGRTGMTVLYFPAFLAGLSSFVLFDGVGGLRFLLLRLSLTVHFLKRVLEVRFNQFQLKSHDSVLCSRLVLHNNSRPMMSLQLDGLLFVLCSTKPSNPSLLFRGYLF